MGADLRDNGQFVQSGDPTTVDETAANQFVAGQIGHVAALLDASPTGQGLPKLWQYVQRSSTDAVTIAAGMTALWKDYDDFVVTADTSDSFVNDAGANHVAGLFKGTAPASSNYGYIQVGGISKCLFKITPTVVPTTAALPVVAGTDGQADCFGYWSISGSTAASAVSPDRPFAKTIAAGNSTASTSSDVVLLIDRVGW
jgi:hypothetical protein